MMSNTKADNVGLRVFENQGIDLDDSLVSEATETVQQALDVLADASDRIAFGIEPSAFLLAFHRLARIEDNDAR
jgi:hypothetical protein